MIRPFSVALLSDLAEESWPSMDLVSEMLYTQLSELHSSDCIVSQLRPAMRRRFSSVPVAGRKASARNADRLINRFFDYPRWLRPRRNGFNLFHLIDHSYSQLLHHLPPGKTVVTCHDLDTFRCLFYPSLEPRSWQFRMMARRILTGLAKASHVLCVSNAVRQDLLNLDILSPDRVSVVLNGVDSCFNTKPDPAADAAATRLLPSHPGPYLLSVGSNIPRKRLDVMLKIVASVREVYPVRLIRVGGPFTTDQQALIKSLRIGDAITILPFLSRAVLASIYRRSTAVLVTSDSEGFGLPLVEAMASGCLVVASDIPVLREIGGQAAFFCPVGEHNIWSQTVLKLLNQNMTDTAALQPRLAVGRLWASQFDWRRSAAKCVEIYKQVLEMQQVNHP